MKRRFRLHTVEYVSAQPLREWLLQMFTVQKANGNMKNVLIAIAILFSAAAYSQNCNCVGSTALRKITGTSNPNGTVVGVPGEIYQRKISQTTGALYVKETGTGNLGWVNVGSGGGYVAQHPDSLLPYRKYVAIIIQPDTTSPPSVTILENTIGDIVWSNLSDGSLYGTLVNAFTSNKTFVLMQEVEIINNGRLLSCPPAGTDNINILQTDTLGATEIGYSINIEIRVYK